MNNYTISYRQKSNLFGRVIFTLKVKAENWSEALAKASIQTPTPMTWKEIRKGKTLIGTLGEIRTLPDATEEFDRRDKGKVG